MENNIEKLKNKRCDMLFFLNSLFCFIATLAFMFFHTISSINVFDVTAGAEELSGDIIVDIVEKVDAAVIKAFILLAITTVVFYIVNFIGFKKKKEKLLLYLDIMAIILLVINITRCVLLYI